MICGFSNKKWDREFIKWRQADATKQIKYMLLLTALVYMIMSIANEFIAPDLIKERLYIYQRYIITSLGLLIAYVAYTNRSFFLTELLLFLAPVFTVIGHVVIFSQLDTYSQYQTELYLLIFWLYTISGLRLVHSIITSSIVFIIGVMYPYLCYPDQTDAFIMHTSWMVITMLFGLVGGYFLQASQKESFLKEKELEDLVRKDSMTGLYNRVKLDEVLSAELNRSQRYKKNIGIMILDIDFFKMVNDTYGHLVGDKVLIEISHYIQENIRVSDTVFRWGGEEFIILCLEVNEKQVVELAEHVRRKVEQMTFSEVGKKTVSIGVTLSKDNDTTQTIIKRADAAVYEAKEYGRNCVKYL